MDKTKLFPGTVRSREGDPMGGYGAGNTLSVSNKMMSTMMACPAMDNATAFKNALMRAKVYDNDGKKLFLIGEHGEPFGMTHIW